MSDQQIEMMLDEDSGGEDDTGELTGELWQEDGGDSDEEAGEKSGSETMEEGDGENRDEEVNEPPTKRKRLRLKDRKVNSLESALNPENYSPYEAPQDEKVLKVVTKKKTKNDPEESVTWTNQQPRPRAGRRPATQVRRVESGVVQEAREAKTHTECFSLFVTEAMIQKISKLTNKAITLVSENMEEGKRDRLSYMQLTSPSEIKAFIGLMYLRGLLGQNHWNHKRLFQEQIGHPIFSATMSRDRFVFLCKMIKFDNPETRPARFRTDRFAAMRSFFECWNFRCSTVVNPEDWVTIDECLYACRNELAFKTYNPNKPAKYGINIKCLNAVIYPYTYHSEVFAGKPELFQEAEHYCPDLFELVVKILEKVGWRKLAGCNLTTDNYYTSIPLASKLLEKNMTCMGTMRHNRKGLDKQQTDVKNREEKSSVVWHEEKGQIKMVSYVVNTKSKGKKNIILLNTVPDLATMGSTMDDDKLKPAAIKVYDFTKGGTDICDQRSGSYTVSVGSRRWTVKIFSYVLDVSRVNSQTVYCLNNGLNPRDKEMSFKFGWELGLSLVKPLMKERRKVTTNRKILSNMEIFLGKQQGGQGGQLEGSQGLKPGEEQQEGGQGGQLEAGQGLQPGVEQQEGEQGGLLEKSQGEDQDQLGIFSHSSFNNNRFFCQHFYIYIFIIRTRCASCVKSLPVEGYKLLHMKMSKFRTQCSRYPCGQILFLH